MPSLLFPPVSTHLPVAYPNPITLLTRRTGWYGRYSGYYEQLPGHLTEAGACVEVISPSYRFTDRLLGKTWAILKNLPSRNQSITMAELRFHRTWRSQPEGIGFIAAIEDHLPGLSYWKKAPARLIGAIHFPRSYWTDHQLAQLSRLSSAVLLHRADVDFFEQFVGAGRVKCLLHGVDTAFFRPSPTPDAGESLRVVFCGQFGRDFRLLDEVAGELLARFPSVHFDLVIPPQNHNPEAQRMERLRGHPRVAWHTGISDEALLGLYQKAAFMLLPMSACGANNAVVEALACGLPLLSNDVGGMRDYGGGSIFPLVPAQDARAMVEQASHLLTRADLRQDISRRSRIFAEQSLAWPVAAQEHLQVMQALAVDLP